MTASLYFFSATYASPLRTYSRLATSGSLEQPAAAREQDSNAITANVLYIFISFLGASLRYDGKYLSSNGNIAFTNATARSPALSSAAASKPMRGLTILMSAASVRLRRTASYTMKIRLRYSFAIARPWL